MTAAPSSGVMTFLFTDIEGSTRLWAADPTGMSASLRLHDELLRGLIATHSGFVFTTAGDSFCAAFQEASDAVLCAQQTQAALAEVEWPGPELRVRMGLHLGDAEARDGDFFGHHVNTAARVESAGHGGQIILSKAVRDASGVAAIDLGTHRLRDVPEAMHLYQLGDGTFPALRVLPNVLSSLPTPSTSFVGRQGEIEHMESLLKDHRLVTITGVGGSGKTRLAIEVAQRQLPHVTHGAYFADLRNVSDDEGVVAAVADAVRLQLSGGDQLAQVLDHLAGKQALVVLDTCEHVIDACAEFAEAALAHPGTWRLIATSRENLDVEGEHVIQMPSLSAADGGAAVELFTDRAESVKPGFRIANRAAVASLCRSLDGMPLAIELAAARVVVMSPTEMLERIDDRFRLLSGGRRRTRQGQRTLEATLDWSYDLLDEREQSFLNSLGVLVGQFEVTVAAAVADVTIDEAYDALASLVAKSLVVAQPQGDRTLFHLLETVRAYAQDHLRRNDRLEESRDRHLDHHVVAVAETVAAAAARSGLTGATWDWPTVRRWLAATSNLEAAIDWAIACDRHAEAGELLVAATPVWREQLTVRIHLDRIDRVVDALPAGSELRERLLIPEIQLAMAVDDHERFLTFVQAAAQANDPTVREFYLVMEANSCCMTNPTRSLELAEEAAAMGLDSSSFWDKNQADVHLFAGEYEQAAAVLRPHQGENIWAVIDGTIAIALLMAGRPAEALGLVEDHPMTDSIRMSFGVIVGLCHLALGNHEEAKRELVDEARSAALGRMTLVSNSALVGLAALAKHEGDVEWATEIILGARCQREVAINALARQVAEQIGVREAFIEQQEAAVEDWAANDRTNFLRTTLAKLDAESAAAITIEQ